MSDMSDSQVILDIRGLKKYFPIKKGIFRTTAGWVRAVDGVDFFIREGETLGVVGESGCGKTTTGRCVIRLLDPTEGTVNFRKDGTMVNLADMTRKQMKEIRREIQIIFQDPFSSLDPRMSVLDIIREPLRVHDIGGRKQHIERVGELLERVGLRAYQMDRYPHEFSGGQRQRIGIARALALDPEVLICDEPVSALDVSVQAQVLNLLSDLQEEFHLTYMFIAHDLSVVEHISDRVMVMYLGKAVEMANSTELYKNPKHPYSEALMMAIPIADPRLQTKREPLGGNVPDPANPPEGCNFNTRCPYVQDICYKEEPPLAETAEGSDHFVACHFAADLSLAGWESRRSTDESA